MNLKIKTLCRRRFNFKEVYNLRELGGYETSQGITKFGVFLRSDCLNKLTVTEINQLLNHGIQTVIDLRTKYEIELAPNPLKEIETITYHNISLHNIDKMIKPNLIDIKKMKQMDLFDSYKMFLSEKEFIKTVFKTLADAKGGCLYHCSAGKDRTGIISALLLLLVGVDKRDVIADYQITYTYLKPKFEMDKNTPYINMMNSDAINMERFIAYIEQNFKNVEQLLLSYDVTIEDLTKIKDKFILI